MNYSLHIGLNKVSSLHYGGWDGRLMGCHNDATAMARIAGKAGFGISYMLLDEEATLRKVDDVLHVLATDATAGSTVMITYSGHGGQVPDREGDEKDGRDETWCLYDGMMLDDRLHAALAAFRKGVRIVVVSDSCHSGTMIRAIRPIGEVFGSPRPKSAPRDACRWAYAAGYYLPVPAKRPRVKASALLLSGCADNQYSWDGDTFGLFTQTLMRVYEQARHPKGYAGFRRAIVREMPQEQTPQLTTLGAKDAAFLSSQPFSTRPA